MAVASLVAPDVGKPMTRAKVADLPRYRDSIIEAIRDNPGKRSKALAHILRKRYAVDVDWAALHDYLKRDNLYALVFQP